MATPLTLARMGYVGSLVIQPQDTAASLMVRLTSADIKVTQEITYPEVVDGRPDRTVYQLGPKIVGGTIAFPLVHEGSRVTDSPCNPPATGFQNESLAASLWSLAASRDSYGRMARKFDAQVVYSDNTKFKYPSCYLNQMTWTITESNPVTVSAEVFGTADGAEARTAYDNLDTDGHIALPNMLSPARIVTWNDAEVIVFDNDVDGEPSGASVVVNSEQLREFTATINNNLDRVYTLNGILSPQDVIPKKREVSGTLKLLGRNSALGDIAYSNQNRYTSQAAIAFGYALGSKAGDTSGSQKYWANAMHSVLFSIEEMALGVGVFETTVNYSAMGDCTRSYNATQLGRSDVTLSYPGLGMDSVNGTDPGTYGGRSIGVDSSPFPAF